MAKLPLYDSRMFLVQAELKALDIVNKREFFESIGFDPTNADKVRKGKISFTAAQINACIQKYGINPAFFFHPRAKMYPR